MNFDTVIPDLKQPCSRCIIIAFIAWLIAKTLIDHDVENHVLKTKDSDLNRSQLTFGQL